MISGLVARHTISRERPLKVPISRGGFSYDFSGAVAEQLSGWAIDSGSTAEDLENRDGAETEFTLRGPFTADVDRHDRITIFGTQYRIEGAVRKQPGPTELTSHIIFTVKRWDG